MCHYQLICAGQWCHPKLCSKTVLSALNFRGFFPNISFVHCLNRCIIYHFKAVICFQKNNHINNYYRSDSFVTNYMYGLKEENTKKSKSSHTVYISTCRYTSTIYLTLQLLMKRSITNSFKPANFVDISMIHEWQWHELKSALLYQKNKWNAVSHLLQDWSHILLADLSFMNWCWLKLGKMWYKVYLQSLLEIAFVHLV